MSQTTVDELLAAMEDTHRRVMLKGDDSTHTLEPVMVIQSKQEERAILNLGVHFRDEDAKYAFATMMPDVLKNFDAVCYGLAYEAFLSILSQTDPVIAPRDDPKHQEIILTTVRHRDGHFAQGALRMVRAPSGRVIDLVHISDFPLTELGGNLANFFEPPSSIGIDDLQEMLRPRQNRH